MTDESTALTPLPLEKLQAPMRLDGTQGNNRAPAFVIPQIAARNDLQAIQCWLAEYEASPQTQRTYRKEAERLLLWSLIEQQKPLSSLTREDLRDYQHFLLDPQPASRWCGPRQPRYHPQWRPFQGPLGKTSLAQAIAIINALFSYLVEAGYLAGNPLGLLRRKLPGRAALLQAAVTERFLEQGLWQVVVDFIETLPQATAREKKEYERCRFLFHVLYLLGPRVSEVANATMGSFKSMRGQWWWQVTGKGQKTQLIPVNEAMREALMRYRQFYGLSPFPSPEETGALFRTVNGTQGVSANMIYRLVKKIFLDCAKTVEADRPDWAAKLKKASTHWLRHTALTHQADAGIDLRYIKLNARHESVETTMRYQHAEDDQWHAAMAKHQMPTSTSIK